MFRKLHKVFHAVKLVIKLRPLIPFPSRMLFRLKSFGLPRSLPAATRSLSSPTQQNGGTRLLLTIRNIDGNITAFAKELSDGLFPPGSPEASRLKMEAQYH
ncbi:54S ribosomal protein mitochondrial [Lentinula edodes]|uniref:54S ribosomal protein mitochondrial n=1 Tax=Lentinula edodes TaxID=5353 RepID=A0A1Q3EGI1_LENED|nr:54S ribosomal protein mitochondrial [Lentinula edodes]